MKLSGMILTVLTAAILIGGCRSKAKEKELQAFINKHLATIEPLDKKINLADWQAKISGKDEDFKKLTDLQIEKRRIYSDANEFGYIKETRNTGEIKDKLLARQLDKLYYAYQENQIDPLLMQKIVELSNKIDQNFSTFRGAIDGQKKTDNEIREVMKISTDSAERQKAWLASKQVGQAVADDLITLVKLRNQAAQKAGFKNYHTMSLMLSEQVVSEVDQIFDELDKKTAGPFKTVKEDLDSQLSKNYNIPAAELMPWHYHDPFFQETPLVYQIDLDVYYEARNVVDLVGKFYAGIGLPLDDVIKNSDLYERTGKNPHAMSFDIDKAGDVRILCNVRNNEQWTETLLHELGHAAYSKYNNPKTPYLLREPAHSFTTEAIAMLFGRLSRDPQWMKDVLGLNEEEKTRIQNTCKKYTQLKQLIFARWVLVMYNFEKALYANPDQNLNALWWNLVEKYQLLKKPAGRNNPDWAAKIHFTIAPCYYHNYALGELLASQLHNQIVTKVLKNQPSYFNQKGVGNFLKQKVFVEGAIYKWNEIIERATGKQLTAEFFTNQFIGTNQ